MTADDYLLRILRREAVDNGPTSRVRSVIDRIAPVIHEWAGRHLVAIQPSGSFAKGTANRSGTDIDFLISLSGNTPHTLREIYSSLFARMEESGFSPKPQNVSINITVDKNDVDLVPAKRQNAYTEDHSIYKRKADSWTKTNITTHLNQVILGRRISETRVLKIWRNQFGIDFPSFYLEMTVIEALRGHYGSLSQNVWQVFRHLTSEFPSARIIDPANSSNVVSDDLSKAEKTNISKRAGIALSAQNWEEIVR